MEALLELVRALPADLAASIVVVLHVSPHYHSMLPKMLAAAGELSAEHARDGETLKPGRIYVAPPDWHLLVKETVLRLSRGPHESGVRPAIDPLFRSAARSLGARVIGVVLSGSLDDGTAGLHAVKRRGGIAIVQDPEEALCPDMPRNALEATKVDYVVTIAALAKLLPRLVRQEVASRGADRIESDDDLQIGLPNALGADGARVAPSHFSCPSCGGVLMEIHDGDVLHFRCQVGHAFGAETLRIEQEDALEAALWAALRALEEKAMLARRLAQRARENRQVKSAERFDARSLSAERQARLVRETLQHEVELVRPAVPARRPKRAKKTRSEKAS